MSNAEESFKAWKDMIASIPSKSPTLTEEQWLDACKYFGGCAYCGGSSIDARSMFIRFKDGGRYCAWNIIPACERCETSRKVIHNPFLRMDQHISKNAGCAAIKYNFTIENLQKIVEYLQSKMEEYNESM